jgi:DNA helicase-2/ATP-dependent DNA helicase PcrA
VIRACGDEHALAIVASSRARAELERFAAGLDAARTELRVGRSLSHVAIAVLTMPGGIVRWQQSLRDRAESAGRRRDAERALEDLRSLCRHVQAYEQREPHPTLVDFLEQAAGLNARELPEDEEDPRITISTIHRCKGAEAAMVVLLGCEERLLPIWQALESSDTERLEEERRLFYVACTRAKDRLLITHCARRGGRTTGGPSRFLREAGLIEPKRTVDEFPTMRGGSDGAHRRYLAGDGSEHGEDDRRDSGRSA